MLVTCNLFIRYYFVYIYIYYSLLISLGASHDSNNNACDGESYIMAAIAGYKNVDTISNVYKFSSCSQQYFANLLSGATDKLVIVVILVITSIILYKFKDIWK